MKKINPFYLQRKGLFFLKNQKKNPFFADKGLAISNIVLKDKGDLITDNLKTNKFIQYLFYKYHWYLQLKKLFCFSEIIYPYEDHYTFLK